VQLSRIERLRARAESVLAPEGPALDLAVLRITVAVVLLLSTSIWAAPEWAALPEAARTIPHGVGWLVPWLRIDPPTVELVLLVFRWASVLGAVGLVTRASWVVIASTASYLLLVPQLGGAVFHDHHLLWLAVIVAASPAGDALSLDAWIARRRGRPRPTRGRAHGLAVRLAWLVIGCVFFFPGVHKLAESGLAWALSDNLRNQMWWKWAQDPALLPPFRLDRHPTLTRGLALATIAFELCFLPLVLHPRTRALAVLSACAFHAGAELFMGIQFSVLWATYTMFVPWQALLDRVRRGSAVSPPTATLADSAPPRPTTSPLQTETRSLRALTAVALPLFSGILVAGAMADMQAYPFACYPTFQWMAPDTMPALEITVIDAEGRESVLDRGLFQEPGPRGWAMSWRLAGVYGDFDARAFEAYWNDLASRSSVPELRDAREVHAARVQIGIDPDRPTEVRDRTPLLVLVRGPNGELRRAPEP
jgi:hypothetical protein